MAPWSVQCAIAEVKQRWSVIGWVTKSLLSRTQRCEMSVITQTRTQSNHLDYERVIEALDQSN
jgi:hypothetical protein